VRDTGTTTGVLSVKRRTRRGAPRQALLLGRILSLVAVLVTALGGSFLVTDTRAVGSPSLLIADHRNNRLLITDFNGGLKWKFNNPTGRTSGTPGPLGVRWMPNNQILATFGSGEVGLIDVATKKWVWKVMGFNGDWFQSPYDAEILPDGNLAVATRFNEGGRVTVYNRSTGAVVWKHLISNAHAVHYLSAAASFDHTYPTLLVGGWGAIREVAYRPSGGQNVTWSAKTEYTHDAIVVETDKILTTEGYYIQKIDRFAKQIWKKMTPDENRRIAVNPSGGYIYTVAESDQIEFRDTNGNVLRSWSAVSDGSNLDYPYGVQVVDYAAPTITPAPTPSEPPAGTTLFADGFESGTFANWTTVSMAAGGTATVQSKLRRTGTYAATFTGTGTSTGFAYARKALGSRTSVVASGNFQVTQEGSASSNVPLLRLYTGSGTRLLNVYRQNQASDKLYVSFGGAYILTTGRLPLNTWGQVSLKAVMNGSASTVEVRLNGTVVYRTTTANLGTSPIATLQLGNEVSSQLFSLTADDIKVTN
jgi:hypothetical protein